MYSSSISSVHFSVLGEKEAKNYSNVRVSTKELFKGGLPVSQGIYDARMGTTDNSWRCETCLHTKDKCPGHKGSIELNYPIQSPIFRVEIIKWLKSICFKCGEPVLGQINLHVSKNRLLTEYAKLTKATDKKSVLCVKCGEPHPNISRDKENSNIINIEFADSKKLMNNKQQLFNHQIQNIFDKITESTVKYFNRSMDSHPRKFITSTLVVPPNTIRPDMKRLSKGGRSNNNELTTLLKNIVEYNNKIEGEINDTNVIKNKLNIEFLELAIFEFIKGTPANSTKTHIITNKNGISNSIASRIPKKEGRIRGNIAGKRCVRMTRSVITGDSNIEVDQVMIPQSVAKEIQIPETVQSYNINRLQIYFNNKRASYPGCTKIIKRDTNDEFWVGKTSNLMLEIGDVIYRDLITGDILPINRQPSLTPSSISAMRIIVIDKGDTIRINVSACNWFNADFDGDQMNGLVVSNLPSRIEASYLSWCGRFFISYGDSKPMVGSYQDGLIGISELTQSDVLFDRRRAMRMVSNTNIHTLPAGNTFTGRDIVSMILPPINLKNKKASHYNEALAPFVKYNPEDILVNIDRGRLVQGVLDKSSVGQGQDGTIYQIIHNEYGPRVAFDTIYKAQKIAENYMYTHGFTISINDMMIPKASLDAIHKVINGLIYESKQITKKLDMGQLIPPIGTTLEQYFEEQQINALNPGDEYMSHIMSNIDVFKNCMYKIISCGSKGKYDNFNAISAAIGQLLPAGQRARQQFGYKRSLPYYTRFDPDPQSRGFDPNNFINGISLVSFIHGAQDGRYAAINNALTTSVTGDQSRTCIKNLESIIVDNLRKSVKNMNIVQFVYGEDGIDPRKMEKVKYPTIMLNDAKFEDLYRTSAGDTNAHINTNASVDTNASVVKIVSLKDSNKKKTAPTAPTTSTTTNIGDETIFDEEFEQLKADREKYRKIFLKLEVQKNSSFTDTIYQPVNIHRIIEDTIFNYKEKLTSKHTTSDKILMIKKVRDFCDIIPYLFTNEIQERKRSHIPEFHKNAITLFLILIRSNLATANLVRNQINNDLLDVIIIKIRIQFLKALMDSGSAVGTLAAQSIGEPVTQNVLNSKHRAGTTGSSSTGLIRIKEIFGAKGTDKMKMPTMRLYVKEQYKNDKEAVQRIANYIEMMPLRRFVINCKIFFENYNEIKHPDYKHESKLITEFEKYSNKRPPNDIVKFVIRFELNKEEMITKNMDLETILISLNKHFNYIFIVNNAENSDTIILRIYIRNIFKKSITIEDIVALSNKLLSSNIRGVEKITYTSVLSESRSYIEPDGSIVSKKEFMIATNGTNLSEILKHKDLDTFKCDTDSIIEVAEVYGIHAARQKIISELKLNIPGLNTRHYGIFADESTYSGHVTSISRQGLIKRESDNILLHVSDRFALINLMNAAIESVTDNIKGLSAKLMVGSVPEIGTIYNKAILNEKFIEDNVKNVSSILESL